MVERRTENPRVGGSIPPLGIYYRLKAVSEKEGFREKKIFSP